MLGDRRRGGSARRRLHFSLDSPGRVSRPRVRRL